MAPIDVDNPETWPPQIHYMTSAWAKQCAGRTRYTNDLPLALELEVPFRKELAGHLVRAYHYTKLLPHEKQMIQRQGLRMLTASLLDERIEAGVVAGTISPEEASGLRASHVFAAGEEQHREGQICLVLSHRLFKRDPGACLPLLESWGGEGLYMSSLSMPFRSRLEEIGTPTRVTALVALEDSNKHQIYPSLHKLFVGSLLRLDYLGADVFYRSPIPPEHIEEMEDVENISQYR